MKLLLEITSKYDGDYNLDFNLTKIWLDFQELEVLLDGYSDFSVIITDAVNTVIGFIINRVKNTLN